METYGKSLLLIVLLAGLALGQTAVEPVLDQTFRLAHIKTAPVLYELATVVAQITGVKTISGNPAEMAITVHATQKQIALAGWLVQGMDRPVGFQSEPVDFHGATDSPDELVRVLYLPHTETVKDFQEMVTAIRSVAKLRYLFTVNDSRSVALRGPRAQAETLTWFARELSAEPPSGQRPVNPEHREPGATDEVFRIFYLAQPESRKNFQEIVTLLRGLTNARQMFSYSVRGAIIVSGNSSQMHFLEWLLSELDQPLSARPAASREYLIERESPDLARVFYLPQSLTSADFQQAVQRVRNVTRSPYCFTYNALRALAMRGTTSQIATAASLLTKTP